MSYLRQKAVPWVSIAVLGGGLAAAAILFLLFRIENSIENLPSEVETILQTL